MALLHHPPNAMVRGAVSVLLRLAGPTGAVGNATVAFGFVPTTNVGCTGVVEHPTQFLERVKNVTLAPPHFPRTGTYTLCATSTAASTEASNLR